MIERSPPIAQQVYEHLRQRLLEGKYSRGQRMPSETQLAEEFQVSRATVRHALAMLEAQRLVSRRQGDGTFATPNVLDVYLKPHNEWQIMRQIEAGGRHATVELLALQRRPASPQEVNDLHMAADQSVLHLRYRFLADEVPVMIGLYTLPEAILKPFNPEDDLKQPLASFVAQFSHHPPEHGHVQFDAISAPPDLAVDLSIEAGAPLLDMHGAVYASDGIPLFLMHEYYRPGEGLRFRIVQP